MSDSTEQYQRVLERGIRLFGPQYKIETEEVAPHRVLREVLRNYLSWRDHLAFNGFQDDVIEHSYYVADEPDPDDPEGEPSLRKVTLTVSFSDLQNSLKSQDKGGVLSERKREALLYNVVFDWLQKDVATKMKITPVSVGQYTDLALRQLSKRYFTADDLSLSQFNYGAPDEDD
jgi:DNA-directed RNA polymerase specialized sigma24 family protein